MTDWCCVTDSICWPAAVEDDPGVDEQRGLNNHSTTTPTPTPANGVINLIIAGAPASGTGTQCEIIKERYGVVHLSTGDMLRAAVTAGTDVGKQAQEFMDNGKLVPDDVIIGVVSSGCCGVRRMRYKCNTYSQAIATAAFAFHFR